MRSTNSGQAALIVILLTAVLVTVGVSTLSQTVTDVRISRQVEDGIQARLTAESATELALYNAIKQDDYSPHDCADAASIVEPMETGNPANPVDSLCEFEENSSYYWYDVEPLDEGNEITLYNIEQGDVQTIWLRDPDDLLNVANAYNQDITFTWEPDDVDVEFIVFSEYNDTDIRLKRRYNNGSPRTLFDEWAGSSGDTGGDADWLFVRVKPLTDRIESMTVTGGQDFLSQGIVVHSGSVTTDGVQKEIETVKRWDNFAPVFDYVLYAGNVIR